MRLTRLALSLLFLGVQVDAVADSPLEPLHGPGPLAASLPCASALAPGLSRHKAGPADRLCRAVAVALLGPALFSDTAVILAPRPPGAASLPRMIDGWAATVSRGQPRMMAVVYAQDSAWARRMQAAAADYGRLFHPGAGLDHVALPPVPAFPWTNPAT